MQLKMFVKAKHSTKIKQTSNIGFNSSDSTGKLNYQNQKKPSRKTILCKVIWFFDIDAIFR